MTRPNALWLTAAAVLVGYFFGWVFPRCMDDIVRGVTTRAHLWTD